MTGNAKLAAADVAEMRTYYATGDWTQRELAEVYGVTQSQVSRVVRDKKKTRTKQAPPDTREIDETPYGPVQLVHRGAQYLEELAHPEMRENEIWVSKHRLGSETR